MDPKKYFCDLTDELRSVKNRVRNLIGSAHWPSDGAWKESALRVVVRGYLPDSYGVGTGFVLTESGLSTQLDIIVYDDSAPLLFRDGDFVVLPPDSVKAVIEVKTSLTGQELNEAIQKLGSICHLLCRSGVGERPFVGLFCYEPTTTRADTVLQFLKDVNHCLSDTPIAALSFGESQFYRYWQFEPHTNSGRLHKSWHAYELENMAPGYFIHNVVQHIFPHTIERAVDNQQKGVKRHDLTK